MRRRPIEPEGMFIYRWWEEGCLVVDLLACLEESSLDTLGLLVPGPVIESVASIQRGRVAIIRNVVRLEGKHVNAIADLGWEDGEQGA